jgi:hypothetical protein
MPERDPADQGVEVLVFAVLFGAVFWLVAIWEWWHGAD